MPPRISIKSKLGELDAVILCGGKGKRLRKLIKGIPKPMAEVGGAPFLEMLIRHLVKLGLRRFILATGYKAKVISGYFRKHKVTGAKISFSEEKEPLGTGGALKKAGRLVKSDPFFLINGDTFVSFDPKLMLKLHLDKTALATIGLAKASDTGDTGVVRLGKLDQVSAFVEKTKRSAGGYSNCGVYLFSRGIFRMLTFPKRFSLEYDFLPKMAGKGFYGYRIKKAFLDIGTPERYKKALRLLGRR